MSAGYWKQSQNKVKRPVCVGLDFMCGSEGLETGSGQKACCFTIVRGIIAHAFDFDVET